jgi:hypothetical protein
MNPAPPYTSAGTASFAVNGFARLYKLIVRRLGQRQDLAVSLSVRAKSRVISSAPEAIWPHSGFATKAEGEICGLTPDCTTDISVNVNDLTSAVSI